LVGIIEYAMDKSVVRDLDGNESAGDE